VCLGVLHFIGIIQKKAKDTVWPCRTVECVSFCKRGFDEVNSGPIELLFLFFYTSSLTFPLVLTASDEKPGTVWQRISNRSDSSLLSPPAKQLPEMIHSFTAMKSEQVTIGKRCVDADGEVSRDPMREDVLLDLFGRVSGPGLPRSPHFLPIILCGTLGCTDIWFPASDTLSCPQTRCVCVCVCECVSCVCVFQQFGINSYIKAMDMTNPFL